MYCCMDSAVGMTFSWIVKAFLLPFPIFSAMLRCRKLREHKF